MVRNTLKHNGGHVTLKVLAEYLGLHPATVSVVLNDIPGRAVPAQTRKRIKDMASQFGYVPSALARSLRTGRTRIIGVVLPDLSHDVYASILCALGNRLTQNGYCYMAFHHGHNPATVRKSIEILQMHSVEGLVVLDAMLHRKPTLPTVTIGCRGCTRGTAQIVFDEYRAVALALRYFSSRGHKRVYLLNTGHPRPGEVNWATIVRETGKCFNLEIVGKSTICDHERIDLQDFFRDRLRCESLGNIKALLTFDIDTARSIVDLVFKDEALNTDFCPVLCIDRNGYAHAEPGIAVVRQPLSALGQISADTILQWTRSSENFAERVLAVQPELVHASPNCA